MFYVDNRVLRMMRRVVGAAVPCSGYYVNRNVVECVTGDLVLLSI